MRTYAIRRARGAAGGPPTRGGRRLATLLVTATALATLAAGAEAARDDLVLASRRSGPAGTAGDGHSLAMSMSADGRIVVFASVANSLSDDDADGTADVFARDLQTNATTLVSRASGAAGPAGDGDSVASSVSGDGRFVAFASKAKNLSAEDADVTVDVFVRDLQTNATTLVSRASGATGPAGDGESGAPTISADGRFVTFFSRATNLSGDDLDGTADVFVRDLQTDETTLVSRESGATGQAGDGDSFAGSISADGRLVAFNSRSNNLSNDDVDGTIDVFVRDRVTNETTLVSRQSGQQGAAGDGDSVSASISIDGRVVAFDSRAANLSAEDADGTRDVFVRDLRAGATTLVSRATGPGGQAGDSDSIAASISADGRFVVFISLANSLSVDDADGTVDVFVRDLRAGATALVSRAGGATGAAAAGDSLGGPISADGGFVAFSSLADNLSSQDADGTYDVFVRDLLGPPAGAPALPGRPVPAASDTTGPVVLARALGRINGLIRVSRTGRFQLYCGRYREPVTGTCTARSVRPVGAVPRRRLRLPSRSFRGPGGRRMIVRFRLSPRDLASLTAAGRLRMLGTVIARDRIGNPTTVRFRFTLTASAGSRHG